MVLETLHIITLTSPETNVLFAKLDLPPGTHHVKFIVDGDMQLSKDLPTAVDWANILVNYIEISADDIPADSTSLSLPGGVHPPMVLPAGVAQTDFQPGSSIPRQHQHEHEEEAPQTISTKDLIFGQKVPQYLLDLDRDAKSHRFQRAANHVQDIPPPPSLPMFMSKSILNGTMPMKDDSSVLILPNHTVLNHVATSSIKNDVLATSVTTRYKRKVSSLYWVCFLRKRLADGDSTLPRSITALRMKTMLESFAVETGNALMIDVVMDSHAGY